MVGAQLSPTRLSVEALETRAVPAALHPARFAVGSAGGQTAIASVYETNTNALLTTVTPFGVDYTGGVRVATGDLTGDGVDDLVAAAGTGGGRVKVYDGATLKVIADFTPYAGTGGAFVAVGDVTGDGRADLVTGAGEGGAPEVRVYRGQDVAAGTPAVAATVMAYDPTFLGGVRVAVGDVAGSKMNDIVAAPGVGGAPTVKVFAPAAAWGDAVSVKGTAVKPTFAVTELSVGGAADTGGVFVAVGDVNGDGRADIIAGRFVNGLGTVTAYAGGSKPTKLVNAYMFNNTASAGGIPVAARDLNGDGKADILVGGGDGGSQVRAIDGRGGILRSFKAFPPNYTGGVYVG